MHNIHSFDVFDTCLLRRCAFPSDIFHAVAEASGSDSLNLPAHVSAEDFLTARVRAETTVRQKTQTEEVTLFDIWQELACILPITDWKAGLQLELRIELDHIRPNHDIRSIVSAARKGGAKIIFVSDTYFSVGFVRDLLQTHGFFVDGDGLYVSSEIGLTKGTGNLFKHIIQREGVRASSIYHLGDNVTSDCLLPKSLGIHSNHYTDTKPNDCELAILNTSLSHKRILSLLAGECRVFRLSGVNQDVEPRSLVAALLGPFLLTFASWVLTRAREDGVSRLYFCSRDCYLLWRTAQLLAPRFGIDVRYLRVSRQALFLPSTRDISAKGMPWLVRGAEQLTIQQVLAKLELSNPELSETLRLRLSVHSDQHVITGADQWDTFWDFIASQPTRGILERKIVERRAQATTYCVEQGLGDSVPWAIVDLGWHLACQTALAGLLDRVSVEGYYLGLYSNRNPPVDAGKATSLFYGDVPDRSAFIRTANIFSYIPLIEHIVGLAPHGTVLHYESSPSGAIASCQALSDNAQELVGSIVPHIEDFVRANAYLVDALGNTEVARGLLDQVVAVFFGKPRREWVEAVRSLTLSEDQNNIGAVPIAGSLTWKDVAISYIPSRYRPPLSRRHHPWVEASTLLSSDSVRAAFLLREKLRNCMHLAKRVWAQ